MIIKYNIDLERDRESAEAAEKYFADCKDYADWSSLDRLAVDRRVLLMVMDWASENFGRHQKARNESIDEWNSTPWYRWDLKKEIRKDMTVACEQMKIYFDMWYLILTQVREMEEIMVNYKVKEEVIALL